MQVSCDGAKGLPLPALLLNDLDHLRRRGEWVPGPPGNMQGILPSWIAQPGAPFLYLGKRSLGPGRNHLAVMLGYGRKDVTVNRFA